LRRLAAALVRGGLGGLQPAAGGGGGGGAEVPGAVRPPGGAEQQPAGVRDRRGGVVPLEGLRARRQGAGADGQRGGVPAAVATARAAQGVRQGAALRAAVEPSAGGEV